MGADTAGPARVPRAHTEATLVAHRLATSAVVIRVDLAVAADTSVGPAAVVTLVVAVLAAVVATTKFSPLWERLRQAVCARRSPPAHRTGHQQRLGLWRQQGSGESTSVARASHRYHRPLSGRPARHLGDLRGSGPTPASQPTHRNQEGAANPRTQTRSPSPTGPYAGLGALRAPGGRGDLHHP